MAIQWKYFAIDEILVKRQTQQAEYLSQATRNDSDSKIQFQIMMMIIKSRLTLFSSSSMFSLNMKQTKFNVTIENSFI